MAHTPGGTMSIDDARDEFMHEQDGNLSGFDLNRLLALARLVARDEIAKLSHALVGEDCSTCGGSGEIDERMGGQATSSIVRCPDCAPTQPAEGSDGGESVRAYHYAVSLFGHLAPQCEPLDDLLGVLTQIDNATTVIPSMHDRIASLEVQLAEATNELHCCDDVHLDGGLASGIGTLRRQRDEATALVERLRGALKPVTITEHDAEMDAFLAGVEGAIEASGCERQDLWECWHQRKKMPWEQCMSGLVTQVGTFADMPVCVSLQKARIDGHLVLFYHATSLVVRHDIVRAWLDAHLPDTARRDGRIVHADAMNAINVMHTLRRAALLSEPQASEGRPDA